ncbi:RNase3 domain protein [Agrilactobacillus composti DSM 18527 = JCM 14202]|uniref:Mini-ribonuclease 3 n=1 Tax=Agrilactobacillus composti DSM 18527 = JCM 14202 TaxID=1423734 RepID=X0PQV4_9LACO|nr:Mini-ribonuclease 3 [Agrilactobacillus composti]KRM32538.1 RNase3 domain protein [Agrilactobacillus composti DSM 18527 = JCM 14202]GAF40157.1 ribonuclease III family protein [Agrilactobacillus composti DSM 18527 = JCM 14202]
MNPVLLNGIDLAYLGDAVYEVFVREHLLNKGITKPSLLQRTAKEYVSAKAQSALIYLMADDDFLTEAEWTMFKRGRNAKSYTKAKNTDATTYRRSTGFEAVFGYLKLEQQTQRIDELANWCIAQVEAGRTREQQTNK